MANPRLFKPSKKKMKEEFPELKTFKCFHILPDHDLKFIWHFANPTSPLANPNSPEFIEKRDLRIIESCKRLYENEDEALAMAKEYIDKYDTLDFRYMRSAIKQMENLDPEFRQKSKALLNVIFNNLKSMVKPRRVMQMSMLERKQFAELNVSVAKQLPEVVKALENGFGMSYDDGSTAKIIKSKSKQEKKEEQKEDKKSTFQDVLKEVSG